MKRLYLTHPHQRDTHECHHDIHRPTYIPSVTVSAHVYTSMVGTYAYSKAIHSSIHMPTLFDRSFG